MNHKDYESVITKLAISKRGNHTITYWGRGIMRLKFLLLIGTVLFFVANPSQGVENTLTEVNDSDQFGVVFSVDCSGSMDKLDADANGSCTTRIAKDLLGLLDLDPLNGKAGLVTWGETITVINLTHKFEDINKSLNNIKMDEGGSNLDLGLWKSINMFKNTNFIQKVIILVSDGNEVRYTPPPDLNSSVIEAKKEEIKIYTVAFGDNSTGLGYLGNMSDYTGGSTYLISDDKSNVNSISKSIYYSIANNTPKVRNLTSNLSSPQKLGTRIEWTADALDPENDTIYYQFRVNGNYTDGNWTTSNTWIWNTSKEDVGDNQIQVRVHDKLHEDVYDSETRNFSVVYNSTPTISDLTSNLSSPQDLGTKIKWTADAHDPENDTISYQFRFNGASTGRDWNNMADYWTESNTSIWNTSKASVGDYQIQVRVHDDYHEYVYDTETRNFTINPAINLTPNPSSPQYAGTQIEWTAVALGLENNTTRYQFWLNGNSTSGNWTTINTWTWNTSEEDEGNNQIQVRVHDKLHEDVYDSETKNFTIVYNSTPTIYYLTPSLSSPQYPGTRIKWTADALDPENDTILYQFWLNGNSTGDDWNKTTNWTTSNSWIWNTSEDDIGNNQIRVRVRDTRHKDSFTLKIEHYNIIEPWSSGIKLIGGNWIHEDNETNITVSKEISVSNGTGTDIKIIIEMPNQTNPSPRKINAVFALDTSGSMKKYYRNDANESAEMVLAWSRFDNVSIVSWDHKHETLSGLIPVAGNEDRFTAILGNLSDICSEKDLTYYDEGLNGSLAILRNRSAEPVGPEKIIIFVTGFGEFKPGDRLDEYVNESKEFGYKIFPIGIEIDETSNTSKDQYQNLKNMSESTGGEFYNMSSFSSEEFNDIMAKIIAKFPNDSIDSSPAKDIVATDTLFPYLIVDDSNIEVSKGNVTTKTNPDGTTTLTWNVGDMNLGESATMTIRTTLDLTLPADVVRNNKWICYKADETTPVSEVTYNWLINGTRDRRSIEIPAGKIQVTQESTSL